MDHYNLITSHYETVYHAQLLYTFLIIAVLTIFACLIVYSTVNDDFKTIDKIEKTQKNFLKNLRKKKHSALEQSYDEVNQNPTEEVESEKNQEKLEEQWANNKAMVWHKLRGDVMRYPVYINFLSVFTGTGTQIAFISF